MLCCSLNNRQSGKPLGRRIQMTASNAPDPPASLELEGVSILVVEDSWPLANALKRLLLVLGADVVGPAATTAEAERLIAEHAPDVALVDIHLRGGERAYGLIDRLHDKGIPVIATTGIAAFRSSELYGFFTKVIAAMSLNSCLSSSRP